MDPTKPANAQPSAPSTMPPDEVRKVAKLARLTLSDEQVALYSTQLTGILRYADRLRDVHLDGVEPMPHVGDSINRLDDDTPGDTLEPGIVMKLAPETAPNKDGPFIKVPKVLGGEGSA